MTGNRSLSEDQTLLVWRKSWIWQLCRADVLCIISSVVVHGDQLSPNVAVKFIKCEVDATCLTRVDSTVLPSLVKLLAQELEFEASGNIARIPSETGTPTNAHVKLPASSTICDSKQT